MKQWLFLIITLCLMTLINWGNPIQAAKHTTETHSRTSSLQITDLQLIYQSQENSEAPYFAADCVVLESGNNQNDRLTLIPFNGYSIAPLDYKDEKLFRQLENPRSDIPDSNKLVFSAIGPNGKKNIYYFDKFNASNFYSHTTTPICLLTNNHNNWNPSFHSKQGLLAYVSDAAGTPQIFLYNLKTKSATQLTFLAQALHPFIDAKGEWIYFTGVNQEKNYDIYKIRPNGQNLVRLTSDPDLEKYPTLTRYGRWIVYERGTKSTRSIWMMSLDGKVQKQLSATRDWASTACMNYTGTKIVFEGIIDGRKGIYLGEIPEKAFAGATARDFAPGLNVEKEVVNLAQFGPFTATQMQKLSQYGFFAVPTAQKQLFFTYEANEYKNLPSFVTADNLLQLLHIVFDTSLRKTEEQQLLPKLNRLCQALLSEINKRRQLAKDPNFLALKRYSYCLYRLLNNKPYPNASPSDQAIVTAELGKIKGEQWAVSAIFPDRKFDYSLFKVRGHYSNSANLRKYFRAMSWLGLINFDSKTPHDRQKICLYAEILTANPKISANFHAIYQITAFFAGKSNAPNFYDFAAVWTKEYQHSPIFANYDDRRCQLVLQKLFQEFPARVQTFYADPDKSKRNVIGFMGTRYVADSHLFGLLFKNLGVKYLPSGLDLFAALGNPTAINLLQADHTAKQQYLNYNEMLPRAQQIFSSSGVAKNEPLFNRWLYLLKNYANSTEKGAPAVLQTTHWQKKKLTSALASWTELKHDTILYGEQVGAECGGGDEPPKVYGYIEPELNFYKTLRKTLIAMNQDLKALNAGGIHGLDRILELLDFFIIASQKELNQIPLSVQENEQIRIIGGLLEANTITALDTQVHWWEITSESAKNMALSADIFSYWGQYQTEGVGYADDLYIIIPVNGQLYLMRGSIFSHYEFLHDKRLNDTEWYELIKSFPLEKRAKWWQPYLDRKKDEIPVPADPYDSGC